MGGPASSTTAEIYFQVYKQTSTSAVLHPAIVWERFISDVYSILKYIYLEKVFHHINNHHRNIQFTMEEEIN